MILIKNILEDARGRLAVLGPEASVFDAAEILANPNTPLAIVCDRRGIAVGVVSSTDVIKAFGRAKGDACTMNVEAIMTRSVFSCHVDQELQSVWAALNAQSLRSAPILDDSRRPQGVVHARDLARALLDEVTSEEVLLRDYVLGIGYQ
ncbi:MAG: CBS domain-containing protein [Steroidobacteraceae bacterium]